MVLGFTGQQIIKKLFNVCFYGYHTKSVLVKVLHKRGKDGKCCLF